MRILFVDDERQNVSLVKQIVEEVHGAEAMIVETVDAAVAALHRRDVDLLVMDVFLPISPDAQKHLGRRARRLGEGIGHLGGLVLLDEVDRMDPKPRVLVHTACNDHALNELLAEYGSFRVPKPSSPDVLLKAVMEAMGV